MTYRLDRYEFKFLISAAQRATLIGNFPESIARDANAGEDAFYRIFSLYYDTPDRECFWEKLRGLKNRRKLRVRLYTNTTGTRRASFVEIKQKLDGRGVKRRVQLPLHEALRVAAGQPLEIPLSTIESRTCREIEMLVHGRGFVPSCCLRYDRQAFADRESDLRITFDHDIRYRMDRFDAFGEDEFSGGLLEPEQSVMEVKVTGTVPSWLTRALAAAGCTTGSRSKYCDAMAAGDPFLNGGDSPQPAGVSNLAA